MLAVFTVLCLISGSAFADTCTPKMETEMDLCGQTVFLLGQEGQPLPNNMEEMNAHCEKLRLAHKCVRSYSGLCLKALAKQVTSLLVKGASLETNKHCQGDTEKQAFLKRTNCFNVDINRLHQCMGNYIEKLEGIPKAKKNEKIAMTCCDYYKFRKCIVDNLSAFGEPCGPEDVTYMTEMLDGFASEVLDLLCGSTPEDSLTCSILESPKKDGTSAQPYSILPPFINIFTNF